MRFPCALFPLFFSKASGYWKQQQQRSEILSVTGGVEVCGTVEVRREALSQHLLPASDHSRYFLQLNLFILHAEFLLALFNAEGTEAQGGEMIFLQSHSQQE